MEDGLKQRLVGAVALIGLAVIFLPAILDGKKEPDSSREPVVLQERPKFEVIAPIVKDRMAEQLAIQEKIQSDRIAYAGEEETPATPNDATAKDESTPASAPSETVAKAEAAEEKEDASATVATPLSQAETSSGLTPTWTIQLASFAEAANANQLKEKLLDDHYHAYTEPFRHEGHASIRVFVGPELTRKRAEIVQQELKKRYQLNGLVVHYVP